MSAPRANGKHAALWITAALLAAFWPVLLWWSRRVVDDSDEPLGVLALICGLAFLWHERELWQISKASLVAGLLIALSARLLAAKLPMLLLGMALILALALGLRLWRLPGLVALFSLALPWVATLQFVLGYPLRVLVAAGAGGLLSIAGVEVRRAGTDLWHRGMPIGVDPPCSGIRMLWFLLFAAAFLAARFRLDWLRTLFALALAGTLALVANMLRATVLFFPEAGLAHWPHWTHEATGLLFFLPCLALLLVVVRRWEKPVSVPTRTSSLPVAWPGISVLISVALALSWLWRPPASSATAVSNTTVTWPSHFRDEEVVPLPLSVREEHFAANFPGALARFRCGEGELILRRVERATRQLHPASDCFQAAGFSMRRLSPSAVQQDGLWQVWEARRGDEAPLLVCEQIRGADGELFTDVSAWYWHALRHPGAGPWMATTWVRHSDQVRAD